MDRIIRTTVGLRPHRDSGFLLRAEPLDAKTVIHHFGHGGAGISLSWGTAALAADLALAHPERQAAVIGCGMIGLSTTRQLQRRGFDVTIYSKAVPPDTTSNLSLASFTPAAGLIAAERRTGLGPAVPKRGSDRVPGTPVVGRLPLRCVLDQRVPAV